MYNTFLLVLGPIQRVTYMYELKSEDSKKVVQQILDEWTAITHLFSLVNDFSVIYNGK
jgi:hypothetical protein